MPAYKDEMSKSWYCKFYYEDWTGQRKQKLKRGFTTKREALEFEREFLLKKSSDTTMSFKSLYELYIEDMEPRLRPSTLNSKKHIIEFKILPTFENFSINEIKPTHIRKWQNELMGMGYAETYLKSINNQLTAIFNYGVKYYDLKENPCHKAGSMGKGNADEMLFWTKEEYQKFIEYVDRIQLKIAFEILYWTGIRIGELMALTPADIDFINKTISITKSLQRIKKQDIITEPKTPKSKRIIPITDTLCNDLKDYIEKLYDINQDDQLFPFSKKVLYDEMKRGCKKSGVKEIRLHDLRHSHASLLVELGFTPVLIAERLGHEKIETTLKTYSHLYPNKQAQVVSALQKLQIVSN